MTKKIRLGTIGKPHGLKGFAYVHLNDYLKNYIFSDLSINISEDELVVTEIKKHMKNRNLIKFNNIDTIEQINLYRGKDIYASKSYFINNYEVLPWPELFVKKSLSNLDNCKVILSNYYVSNFQTVLELKVGSSFYLIPYIEDNFNFVNGDLFLVNSLSVYNPVE